MSDAVDNTSVSIEASAEPVVMPVESATAPAVESPAAASPPPISDSAPEPTLPVTESSTPDDTPPAPPVPAPDPVPPPPPPQTSTTQPLASPQAAAPTVPTISSYLSQALEKIQFRKRAKLDKILALAAKKKSIKNDDVEKLLRVSDSTARRYLKQLVQEGRLKMTQAANDAFYEPI
ncbi:MAG: hypothetical protein WAZ27_01830 [Minisyncoccia bacterium]